MKIFYLISCLFINIILLIPTHGSFSQNSMGVFGNGGFGGNPEAFSVGYDLDFVFSDKNKIDPYLLVGVGMAISFNSDLDQKGLGISNEYEINAVIGFKI